MSFLLTLQVEATFLRAVHEKVKVDHVTLEINSLRYDLAFPCFFLHDPVIARIFLFIEFGFVS